MPPPLSPVADNIPGASIIRMGTTPANAAARWVEWIRTRLASPLRVAYCVGAMIWVDVECALSAVRTVFSGYKCNVIKELHFH